jgi:amino acid transporter/nucleotide-binding universal stress UspA family protein
MKQKLDRTLGMFSAITISVGTMIGSAIFVLAGTTYQIAGPSASLAVFLAGIAAVFTGFSFAELVTIIPKAGGGYVYVKEATGNGIISFICGWGFWLGYAMSCGLFALGFGNFLNYFFPFIPQMLGAYGLILYVIYTNIRGMKNSGKLQDIITTALIGLLILYIAVGIFHVDINYQIPFFTNGFDGVTSAMGILYMTYIGYGLITTVSEEVIDPEKTIPKAILISIGVVIVIKTAVFFIGSGIIEWQYLIPSVTSTPLTDTAVEIAGRIGGYLFALAGLFATLSSINTAVMAASRTSFAMSRDNRLPSVFKVLNGTTKTPIFSILFVGVIIVLVATLKDLEHISTVTSILSLIGYTLVNFSLIIFRKKHPELKRHFKVPLYPLTTIIGISINIFLIVYLAYSDILALIVSVSIISIGLIYYYLIMPRLRYAVKGVSTHDIPSISKSNIEHGLKQKNEIIVPISNPYTMETLLEFGKKIADSEKDTDLLPLHIVKLPENVIISSDYDKLKELAEQKDDIINKLKCCDDMIEKYGEPYIVQTRDVAHGINSVAEEYDHPMVLLGWHKSGLAKNMLGGVIPDVLENAQANICIMKANRNIPAYKEILFPYGGGRYSQLSASIAHRIAKAFDAKVTFLKAIDYGEDEREACELLKKAMEKFETRVDYKVVHGDLIDNVISMSVDYDLLLIGASLDWGVSDYITGARTDIITEKAMCSVIIVKNYEARLQRKGARKILSKMKKILN